MFPPDFEELLARVNFREPARARAHFGELAGDPAEMLALAAICPHLGDALQSSADPDGALTHFCRFVQSRGSRLQLYHLLRDDPAALDTLIHVLAASQYLADVLVRNPEYVEIVSDGALLATPRTRQQFAQELIGATAPFVTAPARLDAVRRFRRREILRIGAADLRGLFDLDETTRQLSSLADAVVERCLQIVAAEGGLAGLVVLALGKLGGGELNYSSDIDLIFVTDHSGHVESATRLARALVAALEEASSEGFLYRVDLRLRPYGGAGALVVSRDMLSDYLATQSQPAERQAMLKARTVAGAVAAGEGLLAQLRQLLVLNASTARRDVRALKKRIERQLRRGGDAVGHVKLGPGGIRDVEFLVQALQLESGGQRPELITGHTLDALASLVGAGLLAADDADDLRDAYVFHRLVEHRLQLMDNQQVHRLPVEQGELKALARTLGFDRPDEARKLQVAYESRVQRVRAIFERLLTGTRASTSAALGDATIGEEVRAQLGPAYDAFDAHDRLQHAELLARICRCDDVEVHATRESHQRWTVTVSTRDHVGVLSIVAGLFAARQVAVASGDVFTLRFTDCFGASGTTNQSSLARRPMIPAAGGSVRKVLDIFSVQTAEWVEASFWTEFRAELAGLVALVADGNLEAARERIIDRVSVAARSARDVSQRLFPVAVEVDNDASPTCTELMIRSTDAPGFLFEFAGALAVLNVNIERVEIRTLHHEVRDTFWVTDARGQKLLDPDRIHELRVAATLIKQFTHLLPSAPNPAQAIRQFSALTAQMLARPDWVSDLQSLQSDTVLLALAELMGVSQFLWEDFLRMQHENLFPVLRDLPALDQAKSKEQLCEELAGCSPPLAVVRGSPDPAHTGDRRSPSRSAGDLRSKEWHGRETVPQPELAGPQRGHLAPRDAFVSPSETTTLADEAARLNRLKDREMFRIDLRHITRRTGIEDFSRELSDLAEVVVARACELCFETLAARFGVPLLEDGSPCSWCVCGLGKFGGRELGFASDIELLFIYERAGSTDGQSSIPNSRFFEELVSSLLETLVVRREGVFEIDLRLRPHGKAGSLACSLAGFTEYFSPSGQAQQFERLALVKLRSVAGVPALSDQVVHARDTFVYSSQPLDYENILHLRRRQAAELVPARQISAKHSLGGLVDLEYCVQAKQIEVGHTDAGVRVTNTLEAIHRLHRGGYFSSTLADELEQAYQFLRRLIEALRVVRGQAKDLTLPPLGSREFEHLARRLDYGSPGALQEEIARRMSFAHNLWSSSGSLPKPE